jgi:hypothetical protein
MLQFLRSEGGRGVAYFCGESGLFTHQSGRNDGPRTGIFNVVGAKKNS